MFQWTYRELHPNLRRAMPVSSCWTISPSFRSGSRETRTRKRHLPPLVFKTSSSSSRMTSVLSCGSWNRTNGLLIQSQASLPTATTPHHFVPFFKTHIATPCSRCHLCFLKSCGGRNRTCGLLVQSQASLPTATTPQYVYRGTGGTRTRDPVLNRHPLCR